VGLTILPPFSSMLPRCLFEYNVFLRMYKIEVPTSHPLPVNFSGMPQPKITLKYHPVDLFSRVMTASTLRFSERPPPWNPRFVGRVSVYRTRRFSPFECHSGLRPPLGDFFTRSYSPDHRVDPGEFPPRFPPSL